MADGGFGALYRAHDAWLERQIGAIVALARTHEREMEAWAKEHAPWDDRTSNARQGLTAYTDVETERVVTTMAHTVDYGVYLELAQRGRRPIILPARDRQAPLFVEDVDEVVGS